MILQPYRRAVIEIPNNILLIILGKTKQLGEVLLPCSN